MAKRRLNKKVALIGSAIFIVVALGAILVILYLSRDPAKFIAEGDAAWQAKDYERAERSYHKARSLTRDDSLRKDILFKLVDVYIETGQWRFARGCWEEIVNIDPKDVKARYARLKFSFIMADSGLRRAWQDVRQQASDLINIVEQAGLLKDDTGKWETTGLQTEEPAKQSIGLYLYLLRGRTSIEMARQGMVTNPDEALTQSVADLEKALTFDQSNVDARWYLAQGAMIKGELFAARGNVEERDKAAEQAKLLTEQAVKGAPGDPKAHLNFLAVRFVDAQKLGKDQVEALEQEYLSLANKFPSYAEVFARLSRFYSDPGVGTRNLDKAVKAIEQAINLDKNNVTYAIVAANLWYRKSSYQGQKADLDKAIEVAKHALTLPDAQEETGPHSWANRLNRVSLYIFLANFYIEQLLEPRGEITAAAKEALLKDADQAVYAIEQLLGSGEDPQVVKWKSLLELAKGNKKIAIKKLYAVYEQLKASSTQKEFERIDAMLAYRLAKIFENTDEIGAANEFFIVALRLGNRSAPDRIDEKKPEAFLDYAEVLLKLGVYNEALNVVNFFETQYWPNERSRILRIKAYIGAKQFDNATEELANRPENSTDTIKLNLQLVEARIKQTLMSIAQKQVEVSPGVFIQPVRPDDKGAGEPAAAMEAMKDELQRYRRLEVELVKKLLAVESSSVGEDSIIGICKNYIELGRSSEAQGIVSQFLKYSPDSTAVLIYKQVLSDPDPANVSQQRRREIEEQVLSAIADPIRRAVTLGVFYRRNDQLKKAAEQFQAALDLGASRGTDSVVLEQVRVAARSLFDVALLTRDWNLADQLADRARRENLDDCEGHLFAARLLAAKGQFKEALSRIDEALKQKPIFSHAYMLRSNVNADLGDEHASIQDARKAATLSPLDGNIAKGVAIAFCKRDRKLDKNVPSHQMEETRAALDRAVVLNQGDLQLLDFYTDYISSSEPLRALAIRQSLHRVSPSLRNALRLGQLAVKLAREQTDQRRKDALFSVAEASYQDAQQIDPNDREVLYSRAELLRAKGQDSEAEKLLEESRDQKLLWNHYFQRGQYDDARKVLEQMYKSGTKDTIVLKGLLLVAERTTDQDAIKKYSDELVTLEGNVENHLIQIQSFLRVGLIKEAELKLQGFREKYPQEPKSYLLEALLAMRQGQLQKALDLTNRNLQSDQNNASAWRLRGEINFYMAAYDQAISDLKASKALADDPFTRISLARAYLQASRIEDAVTELKNTIDMLGAPIEGRRLLEQLYLQLGRKDALNTLYDDTIKKFPDSTLWHNRAASFAATMGNLSKAEQLYKESYLMKREASSIPDAKDGVQDVQYATAFDGYLRTLVIGAGDPGARNWNPTKLDKVFEECKPYLDSAFAPIVYLRMAEAKLKLNDKTTAIEYCRKAVDKAGTNESFASEVLLRMYLMLGPQEVSKYCEQRLRTDPRSLPANFTMFNLARINEKYDEAMSYIDKCIEIVGPDDPRKVEYVSKKAEVLTLAYDRTSDNNYLQRAIADYESLLVKMPNNTNVLNNLAYMLAENNEKLPEALQYAKRAFDASPNDPSFMDTYAYVLYKNGKTPEAAQLLAAALQQYEQQLDTTLIPPEVYEHLGMVKEKLGAKTEAVNYYKRALEVGTGRLSQKHKAQIDKAVERLSP